MKAQEERHAQLVCSTGDERAIGFPAVRAAEEQRNGRRDHKHGNGAEKERAFQQRRGSSKALAAKGVFALPATPRPAPFPGPAEAAADARPPGQLVPRYEFAGMYDYINFAPGDPFANFNSHGGSGSFTYNASRWLDLPASSAVTTLTAISSP